MATFPQFYEVLSILSGRLVKEGSLWTKLDTQRLQEQVIKDPDRFASEFVSFIGNGARLLVGELKTFPIDRSIPFNPAEFKGLGKGWSIWKGPKDGNGLEGEEEQDALSLKVAELNLSKIVFEHCLKGKEQRITGEDKVARLKQEFCQLIRTDARIAQALFEEPGHKTLEWIRTNLGKTWFDFPGTVLRGPFGSRCILDVCWGGDRWYWRCSWLGHAWLAEDPSFLLASTQPSTP